ncbi:MAG: hypothetical protein HKN37_13015, partial [Rhodothermales bacterium]|nr:hypothetical protein [Rhodothermales bacterium]
FSILEIEQIPEARQWLFARGSDPVQDTVNGEEYLYRVFTVGSDVQSRRLALVINLTQSRFQLLEDSEIDHFLGT